MLSIIIKVFLVLCFDVGLMLVNCNLEITDVGDVDCPCPGNNLTLKCSSAIGKYLLGSITWKGSAFNCTNQANEMVFLHANVGSNGTRTCNNGSIMGWSLLTNNDSEFTSMLSVLINSALIGKSITCYNYDGVNIRRILGSYTVLDVTVSINYTPGPIGSYLLKFNWSVTANNHSECATNVLTYILTSNCGICPSTTNNTNVTCNYSGNHSADGCMFTVKFVVCESQFQDTVTVNLLTSDDSVPDSILLLPILGTISILLLFIGLISLFALIVKSVLSCRKIKATDQIQARNRSQFMEMDCNVYDAIDEDHQTENNIIKIVDNKNMGIYCGGLKGCQYEEYIPTFREGVLNLENILVHLRGRVTFKWYKFGIALGVPSEVLEQHEGSLDKDALTEVLKYWLENHSSEPTWKEVSSALQDIIS